MLGERALLLGLVVMLPAICGCSRGIPGVTHSREIHANASVQNARWNPDSSAFVYAISSMLYRDAIGLNAFPDGGVRWTVAERTEVYTYDLRTRRGPRLVFTIPSTHVSVLGWEEPGVLVRWAADRETHFLCDPERGGGLAIHARDAETLTQRFERPEAKIWPYDLGAVPRIVFSNGQAFVTAPYTQAREWLFDLPLTFQGHDVARKDDFERARDVQRAKNELHQIRTVEARVVGSDVVVRAATAAPQPGQNPRRYDLVCRLVELDTVEVSGNEERPLTREVHRQPFDLGPGPGDIAARIPVDAVWAQMSLQGRRSRRGRFPLPTNLTLGLDARPVSADAGRLTPDDLRGQQTRIQLVLSAR